MAEISYNRVLSSKPFRFLVGPGKKEFIIHSALVASQSRVLESLVNGPMKEAIDGCTTWESIDEATFIRFGQFVYTGNYEGEPPIAPPGSDPEPASKAQTDDDFWSAPTKKKARKKSTIGFFGDEAATFATKREKAWHDFQNVRTYNCGIAGIHFAGKNTDSREEYREVFLSHARLHILADYYEIKTLSQLSLHKLHRTLSSFELHDERVSDINELLRFCFEQDERVSLRELVSMYVACNFEKLWASEEFRHLSTTSGDLSMALMDSLLSRLD